MNRAFRNLLYFAVGLLLGCVSALAFAETCANGVCTQAATGTPRVGAVPAWFDSTYAVGGSVPLAICQKSVSGGYLVANGTNWTCMKNGSVYSGIFAAGTNGQNTTARCLNGDPGTVIPCTGTVYSCPTGQNWTLSGSTCTRPDCVSPQTRQSDGTCKAPDCPEGQSYIGTGKTCVSETCPDGSKRATDGLCRGKACDGYKGDAQPPGLDYSVVSECSSQGCTTTWWKNATNSVKRTTGGECNPSTPSTETECAAGMIKQTNGATTKCYPGDVNTCASKGQCSGTVGNVTVCVACATDVTTTNTSSSSTTTTTTDAATGTTTSGTGSETTSQEVTTDGKGDATVKETTTTKDANGNVTVKQTTETLTSYCTSNPNASICKATEDQCLKTPDLVGCKLLGSVAEESALTSKAVGVSSVTAISLPSNDSCPSDIRLPHGSVLSWSPVCQSAGWLKPLILALAWLAAGYIVLGVKNG